MGVFWGFTPSGILGFTGAMIVLWFTGRCSGAGNTIGVVLALSVLVEEDLIPLLPKSFTVVKLAVDCPAIFLRY